MSEASSLTGRKRERTARSNSTGGATDTPAPQLERIAQAREACIRLRGKPYRKALNELAAALQNIFEARLVVIRTATPGEPIGLAPAGVDPREWLDTLDRLDGAGPHLAARSISIPIEDAWPRASGVEQFVVLPLEQASGRGAIWLGLGTRVRPPPTELAMFELLGDAAALALSRLLADPSDEPQQDDAAPLPSPTEPTTADLVSIAAHELRTPLTPITMLLQSVERKARGGSIDFDALTRTRRQVARLSQMIADLLDITRLREGRLELTSGPVDLGASVGRAVGWFRDRDPKRRIELNVKCGPITVMADEPHLIQAESSLIEHMARLQPPDGSLHVTVERRGERVAIVVAGDPLPTMPDPFLQALCDKIAATPKSLPLPLSVLLAQGVVTWFGGTIAHRPEQNLVELTLPTASGGS